MELLEFYGITKERAIYNAERKLGIDKEALVIKYIENEPENKKIISSILDEKRKKIEVRIIENKIKKNIFNPEDADNAYIKIKLLLDELKELLKEIEFDFEIKLSGRKIYIDIITNMEEDLVNSKDLIDKLEKILNGIINKNNYTNIKTYIDTKGYNKKRKSELVKIAKQALKEVNETEEPFEMEPMNAYERRIVHAILKKGKVKTKSKGKEPNRHIVVYPIKK